MPDRNGNKLANDMDFENTIEEYTKKRTPAEQFVFLAKQLRGVQKECAARKNCPANFQFSGKQVATGAGGVSLISAIIYIVIEIIKAVR